MKQDYNVIFEKVFNLVATGLTIERSLKKLKIIKTTFYKNITDKQKYKLIRQKVIHSNVYTKTGITPNFEDEEDY